ncbi:hypothetical protein SAMN05660649_04764 [Desulfotomaculum arcticum]|uniref:Uncharacterized protein n=1 Tax=Desulfotruncus arcticus DSM 17038 TaxID=1121424 RepID=A0A1I2Z7Z7_9FIRM|nr:hypothetical protein [Desulfotruncus arcticus]SFH33191.1 hypothetical protein SAMN05660649_04764 [Desulfotomaculum arcticum] [Desulfotruncus arcticus DSM 17038]
MGKKLTHEDLMRETSKQESIRMKTAEETIKAAGWYEAGGISFYFHPDSCYWMDLNTGVIAIYHKGRKDIGGIDSVADGYAYTGEDALSWIREHDPNYNSMKIDPLFPCPACANNGCLACKECFDGNGYMYFAERLK